MVWVLLVLDLLVPPLYFARRRRWVEFVLVGLIWLLGVAGLWQASIDARSRGASLFSAALVWGLCLGGVAASAAVQWVRARTSGGCAARRCRPSPVGSPH